MDRRPQGEWWHHLVTTQGFSGVDFVLPDYRVEDCQENNIMIATATQERCPPSDQKRLTVVVDVKSSVQAAVADGIPRRTMTDCDIVSMNDLAAVTWSRDNTVVFLPELESRFLYSLEEKDYRGLQKIIWVCSIDEAAQQSPQSCMVNGLARVLCTENSNLSLVTIALEDHGDVNLWAQTILKSTPNQ